MKNKNEKLMFCVQAKKKNAWRLLNDNQHKPEENINQ